MKKAILFLIFNRLDTTQKVFEEIRKAKPPRLYLASDGARENKEGEKEIVKKTRDFVVNNIDWECEVNTLFRENNLGCKKAVGGAITWFFEQEEDGIILEDDCLPHPSFFKFCEELLDYYKDNKEVWHISGDQFVPNYDNGASYYFAKIEHCWGWATWADRWKYFDDDLSNYDENNIKNLSSNENAQKYWLEILNKMKRREVDSWAYAWTFNIVERNGFCINPSKNLISNIGFSKEGTHTYDENNPVANMTIYDIGKIIHPKEIKFDEYAIDYIFKDHFCIDIKMENGKKDEKWRVLVEIFSNDNLCNKIVLIKNNLKIKNMIMLKNLYGKYIKNKKSEEAVIFEKYRNKKRFVEEKINFRGVELVVPDVVSFAYQVKEIFSDEVYKFQSNNESPLIYDCGANIGTSILYFKKIFPSSKIKAFEADQKIYNVLSKNVGHLKDVQLFHQAIWINDNNLSFSSEGADGGSLVGNFDEKQSVKAVRLKELIEKEDIINFLKIDIEGAEVEVIKDCANSLKNVEHIFVEYHSFKNKKQELDEILAILKNNGFRYYIETINKPVYPFVAYADNSGNQMDLQVNIFGTRVKF